MIDEYEIRNNSLFSEDERRERREEKRRERFIDDTYKRGVSDGKHEGWMRGFQQGHLLTLGTILLIYGIKCLTDYFQ